MKFVVPVSVDAEAARRILGTLPRTATQTRAALAAALERLVAGLETASPSSPAPPEPPFEPSAGATEEPAASAEPAPKRKTRKKETE